MSDTVRASRRHPVPDDELTYEPSARRVRGVVGDTTVVDSRRPLLVWEPGRPVPLYAFPRGDVRTDLLAAGPAVGRPGAGTGYNLALAGRQLPAIAWDYEVPELADHIAFDWFGRVEPGVEHWYEEDEEVFVHPRDPYKRVDALPSSRHVQVSVDGTVVADTRRPVLVFETRLPVRYYIPPEDVDFHRLTRSVLRTRCPYKGEARYWSVSGDQSHDNIVWTYQDPIPSVEPIRDHLAFYNEVVDITVDGELLERPVTVFSERLSQR
ncbi:DUF427 domain-containing protein [Kutzneria sp. NPDC052558]|uniref:DUF427 domain-containing protein n=1 Tax=Kutzneria sp. NPDC052558 TaxID=3364121 RepID=UPI0037C689EF